MTSEQDYIQSYFHLRYERTKIDKTSVYLLFISDGEFYMLCALNMFKQ